MMPFFFGSEAYPSVASKLFEWVNVCQVILKAFYIMDSVINNHGSTNPFRVAIRSSEQSDHPHYAR
jgi:hypothetical protein